jgi:hypothetical protein
MDYFGGETGLLGRFRPVVLDSWLTEHGPVAVQTSAGSLAAGDAPLLTKAAQRQLESWPWARREGYELDRFWTVLRPFERGEGRAHEFAFLSGNGEVLWRKVEGRKSGSSTNSVWIFSAQDTLNGRHGPHRRHGRPFYPEKRAAPRGPPGSAPEAPRCVFLHEVGQSTFWDEAESGLWRCVAEMPPLAPPVLLALAPKVDRLEFTGLAGDVLATVPLPPLEGLPRLEGGDRCREAILAYDWGACLRGRPAALVHEAECFGRIARNGEVSLVPVWEPPLGPPGTAPPQSTPGPAS